MNNKLKISKTPTQAEEAQSEEQPPLFEDAPVEALGDPEPAPAPKPEDYGKGGVYRSIGGGKRVRI